MTRQWMWHKLSAALVGARIMWGLAVEFSLYMLPDSLQLVAGQGGLALNIQPNAGKLLSIWVNKILTSYLLYLGFA